MLGLNRPGRLVPIDRPWRISWGGGSILAAYPAMTLSVDSLERREITAVAELREALLSFEPGTAHHFILEEPNVGLCQVSSVQDGYRVEWMENLASDGPRLLLARAHVRGSVHPDSVPVSAASTPADRLSFDEALSIATAFYRRQARPTGWDWVPVAVAPTLEFERLRRARDRR